MADGNTIRTFQLKNDIPVTDDCDALLKKKEEPKHSSHDKSKHNSHTKSNQILDSTTIYRNISPCNRNSSNKILTNVGNGELTNEEIPENAKQVVRHFNLKGLKVVLLILDQENYPTKISVECSKETLLKDKDFPKKLDEISKEIKTGYSLREFYYKAANPGVPIDTFNFVLDRLPNKARTLPESTPT